MKKIVPTGKVKLIHKVMMVEHRQKSADLKHVSETSQTLLSVDTTDYEQMVKKFDNRYG